MLVEDKTAILNSGDFLPATEVARLAGFSSTNLSVQPNKWKRNREIFAIQHRREDCLPLYGLNLGNHRPRKEIAEILNIFLKKEDAAPGCQRLNEAPTLTSRLATGFPTWAEKAPPASAMDCPKSGDPMTLIGGARLTLFRALRAETLNVSA